MDPGNFVDNLEVCSVGDRHICNVLLSKEKSTHYAYDVLMVDYEIAGYHSSFLDLAKPYYVDVFFSIFFADLLSPNSLLQRGFINLSIENNGIHIDFDIKAGLSPHAFFVQKMKWKGLINPFKKYLSLQLKNSFLIKDQMNTFRAGLFANPIYARNFSHRTDLFFANLALGILLFLERM